MTGVHARSEFLIRYLTRKSLRGKAIRPLRPQAAHPVSRRHYVTVT